MKGIKIMEPENVKAGLLDPASGDHAPLASRLPSLRGPLVLLIIAVVGQIFIVRSGAGGETSPQDLVSLSQIFTAATWVGAVWLGALLAYRGILRSRS
jgi:hypothetical protein